MRYEIHLGIRRLDVKAGPAEAVPGDAGQEVYVVDGEGEWHREIHSFLKNNLIFIRFSATIQTGLGESSLGHRRREEFPAALFLRSSML